MPYAPHDQFDPSLIFRGIAGAGQALGGGIAEAKKKREEAEAQMAGSMFGFSTLDKAGLISEEEKEKFFSGNANQRNAIVMSATPRLLDKFRQEKEANDQAYRMQELAMRQQVFNARQHPYIDPETGLYFNGTNFIKPPSQSRSGGIPPDSMGIARGNVNSKGEFTGDNNGRAMQILTPDGKPRLVPFDAFQRSQGQGGQAPAAPAVAAAPEQQAAPAAPLASSEPVTVNSPSEAQSLPAGTRYRTPDGRMFIR